MQYLIKHDHKFAENVSQLTEHQRKLEWFETIINSMKKRLGELQKAGKDTAAKIALSSGVGGGGGSRDPEEEQRQREVVDGLEASMKALRKTTEQQRLHVDVSLAQLGSKADSSVVN